jgi:hypothetical protein
MKHIIKITFAIAACMFACLSCETDQGDLVILNEAITTPEFISEVPNDLAVTEDNLNEIFATIKFKHGTYAAAVPYRTMIEISTGSDFQADAIATAGAASSTDSIELKFKELNAALAALSIEPNVPVTVYMRLKTAVSVSSGSPQTDLLPTYSAPVAFTITPYEPQPGWIYAIGEFNGWNANAPEALCSRTDNGIYIGYLLFATAGSEFLIVPDNPVSWANKWGSDDGVNLIEDGDNNISAPASIGYHKVTVNIPELKIAIVPYSWGVIGDATPGSWDSDTDMAWNSSTQKWELTIALTAGGLKFRLNDDWGVNYGGSELVGTFTGDNIPIPEAGTYLIVFDELNEQYAITKQ